jgi:Flp pilus assembly pilin Flp
MLALYSYCRPYLSMLKSRLLNHDDEEGQTMVEYVMMIVLVAIAVFVASPSITSAIIGVFSGTSSVLGGSSWSS